MTPTLTQQRKRALARDGRSLVDRLIAYLAIDPTGRPGAAEVRERQQRMTEYLTRIGWDPADNEIRAERRQRRAAARRRADELHRAAERRTWRPRSRRWTATERAYRRAVAAGLVPVAVAVAEAYHERVEPLYASQYASVEYGVGGREVVDWDVYASSYSRPCTYKMAGARVEFGGERDEIVLTNSRGEVAARIPVPAYPRRIETAGELLLDRDVYAHRLARRARRCVIYRCYGYSDGWRVPRPRGVAVRSPSGEVAHGDDLDEALRELEAREEGRRARARERRLSRRQQRAARKIAVYCGNLRVEYRHARAAWLCDSGIREFCARHGLDPREGATAAQLRAYSRARPAIQAAAEELAATRTTTTTTTTTS